MRPRRTAPAGPARRRWCKARGADRQQGRSKASEAALALVLRKRPDIVITDLVMLERLPPGDLPDPFIYLII
jgi:hypothetical protein